MHCAEESSHAEDVAVLGGEVQRSAAFLRERGRRGSEELWI